jgi:hypothetical protein
VFPTSRVVTPEVRSAMHVDLQDPGQCLVVWDGDDRPPLPPPLRPFLEETLHAQPSSDQAPYYIDARLKRSHQQVFHIGFLLFPDGLGNCR